MNHSQHTPPHHNTPPRLSLVGQTITAPPVRPRQAPVVLHTRVVTGSGGGPDKTILRSPRYIDPARLQMAAAYIRPRRNPGMQALRRQADSWGCPLHEIPETGPIDPYTVKTALRLCRQLNVRVWHGHDYKSNLLGLVLRRRWPMKLVTTVHGWTWHTARTRFYYHLDNWALARYDHVIVVNPKLYDHCRGLGLPDERLTYIPNAIEPSEYPAQPDTTAARRRAEIPDGKLVIGVVGRLSVEKGVDRAIRTLAKLKERVPNAQLHLIGDGPERAELEQLTVALGLTDAVHFWGWQSQAKSWYPMMDALLLPSHTEGLPNVVLEAMTMGVPVAATDVGGVRDLLDHGRCGVILGKDESTWADRIAYLLASPDRRDRIASLARDRIHNHYTFSKRMERVFAVYQDVLGSKLLPVTTTEPARRAA